MQVRTGSIGMIISYYRMALEANVRHHRVWTFRKNHGNVLLLLLTDPRTGLRRRKQHFYRGDIKRACGEHSYVFWTYEGEAKTNGLVACS